MEENKLPIGVDQVRTLSLSLDETGDSPAVDRDKRTVRLAFSSETPVLRQFGYEILDHSADAVDLSRLRSGAPLLLNHDTDRQIGVVEEAWIDPDRTGRAVVRFGTSTLAREIFEDVVEGIRKKVSVGYRLEKVRLEGRTNDGVESFRATRWAPHEITIATVPADDFVGIGRTLEPTANDQLVESDSGEDTSEVHSESPQPTIQLTEVRKMENENQQTPAPSEAVTRAGEIMELGRILEEVDLARHFVAGNKTTEEFRAAVLDKRVKNEQNLPAAQVNVDLPLKDAARYSMRKAIIESADGQVSGLEREVADEIEKQLPAGYKRRGGILVATNLLRKAREIQVRAGLDSLTATKGPETIFTEAGDFIDLLRKKMMTVALGVRVLSGLVGPVSFPKQSGAASGSWVAENSGADVADSNLTLGTVTLGPKTYQASTSFSRQLLAQSSFDAEMLVRDDLATIHALAADLATIAGTGSSNQPTGILNTSGVGAVALGTNGAVPTYDAMVDLETAVANANADQLGAMAYLTTSGIRGKLKKTQEFSSTNGKAVWADGEVNGYRAEASNQVPSTLTKGTSSGICHAIIFGVWSQAMLGEWGALELITDPYRLKKQGMIEVTSFQMMDVAVRQAAAFAKIVDALTS